MLVTIDPNAGFCFGVHYAIEKATFQLTEQKKIYCLGEIVHNEEEQQRLEQLGLITIDYEKFKTLHDTTVLIRAHGEPPQTYKLALQNNIRLIDATCPIVLRLQLKIRQKYLQLSPINGQIVIFGKPNHPEVIGLTGQTDNQAIVVSCIDDLNNVDFSRPVTLFSQTTMSATDYQKIIDIVLQKQPNAYIEQSMCKQVANRSASLQDFCRQNDVVVFVSGKNSSNGKYLFSLCSQINHQTYFVSNPNEILAEWFENANKVGITGATSTPQWLMEQVKQKIEQLVAG